MVLKVIVFGAHGKVGQQLIKLISLTSYKATAVVRNDEQAQFITSLNADVSTTQLLLDESSVEDLAGAIKGHDAVVFTAGSAGKSLLKVDLDLAVKTFEAAATVDAKRYVLISAIHADQREYIDSSSIREYYIAKHYADRILNAEFKDTLNYTILRPTLLTDGEGTGKYRKVNSLKEDRGTVDRIDVAKVIIDVLDKSETFGKSYDFANGDQDAKSIFK